MNYKISIGEQSFDVDIGSISPDGIAQVQVNGAPYAVRIDNYAKPVQAEKVTQPVKSVPPAPKKAASSLEPSIAGSIRAPISGLILDIKVKEGDSVKPGQVVATLEAMKMENKITASASGVVKELYVQKGKDVSTGDILMVIG